MSNQSKSKKENKEEIEELKGQLARALADYDNLRKRVEREREEVTKIVSLRLILRLLSVFDTLEVAQNHLKDKGLELATNQFKSILEEEGIEELEKKENFDPNEHEAIETVEGGVKDKIAGVILKGYKFSDGEIIRHAKVRVFKGK